MKSLQNQYNLIKEGKGNKETFLKEAKTLFPNVVTNVLTYDQAIHNLTERGIISEGFIGISSQRAVEPNWFKIFNENVGNLTEGDIKQAVEFYNKNQHMGTKAVAEKFGVEEADLMKALGQTPGGLFESEGVKATLKQTDKSVEEKETAGYDYKDKKSNNNISTAEILTGYYAEMKNPKNADKTETEIKAIVFKNLEKDPLHYVKGGQFGIEGVGYTEEAPGLGKTKEVTGKYKSSGMEPVKLTESKSKIKVGDVIKHKLTGAKIKVKSIAGNNIEGTYVELGDMEGKVKKGDTIKTNVNLIGKTYELNEVFYGSSGGDYEADQENEQMAYYNYDKGLEAYGEGDFLKADRYYTAALRYGSYLGWTEKDLPPYSMVKETYNRKKLQEGKVSNVSFDYELEEVALGSGIYNVTMTVNATVTMGDEDDVTWFVDSIDKIEKYNSRTKQYESITLNTEEEEKLKEELEGIGGTVDSDIVDKSFELAAGEKEPDYPEDRLEEADDVKKKLMPNKQKGIADSIEIKSTLEKVAPKLWAESDINKAKEILKKHIEDSGMNDTSKKTMLYNLSTINTKSKLDYYVANALLKYEKLSVKEGMVSELNLNIPQSLKDMIEDATKESENGYVQHIEYAGPGKYRISDWFDSDNTVYSVEDGRVLLDKTGEINPDGTWKGAMDETKHSKTLAEAKKRAIEKHLKEIEKLGEIAAIDHKIEKIQEKIEELKNKITMTEGGDFAEMVDRTAVREIKKDIALLEKRKKMAEAQKARLGKKVSGQGKSQTHAGGGYETGMMENREQEEGEKAKEMARNAMKRAIGLGGKSKSWEDTVKDVLAAKNVKK